jgi:heme-degrading monooxygenase HmoA
MFARVSTVTGAQDMDAGVALLRDRVEPEAERHHGFRGLTASGNRSTGEFGVLGLWETLEDLEASGGAISKLRADVMRVLGGEITVETMEQTLAEVVQPRDMVRCTLVIVRAKMDADQVDEHLAVFRSEVAPTILAMPGLVSIRQFVDRSTGDGVVGTVWSDEESARASRAAAEERRRGAAERGVQLSDPSFRTILFSHLV